MKKCCAFLILLTAQVVLGQGKDGCYDSAKTQADLNHCADNDYASADKKLNEVYQQVLKQYATDSAFIAKLKVAQRAWLAFRDAELQALYPAENKPAEYGSAWPMCRGQQLALLTEARVQELQRWLKGAKEGDACAGSVRDQPEAGNPNTPK
jgi:uncharacterized protein YecT (DUF1311 family)